MSTGYIDAEKDLRQRMNDNKRWEKDLRHQAQNMAELTSHIGAATNAY